MKASKFIESVVEEGAREWRAKLDYDIASLVLRAGGAARRVGCLKNAGSVVW